MNILLSGGTGFIGKALVRYFIQRGHVVYVLTRRSKQDEERVRYIPWMTGEERELDYLKDNPIDVCINLAGEPMYDEKWTSIKKERIITSRIEATTRMISLVKQMEVKPHTFIQGSSTEYYGFAQDERFTDRSLPHLNSFSSEVCEIWENTFLLLNEPKVRMVTARMGIVLDDEDGPLEKLATPIRYYLGGKVASGEQWVSWIHLYDLVRMLDHIINSPAIIGPVNVTSPNPVRMDELGKMIAEKLHKPYWLPLQDWLLKMIYGERSDWIIEGKYVYPEKVTKQGFTFLYPTLSDALFEIYS
ncbi:TIGR01777 family oxidoreductase [Pontibacillus litoralis]|uniref:Multidrug MFS transporter n=1 Tax=Pontibacillus litoralis JSM 072002 TaxID=1385512 RepID=A0A0A5FUG2_9BACI|nr:TIGR01777 family oxidoreductase [Pontibacillus litoralis]KGX84416.1 hypothetical protein N784_13530 [Pontibacillus litoralis JSM 072002]